MRIAFIGAEASAGIPLALATAGHEITSLYGPGAGKTPTPLSWKHLESRLGMTCAFGAVTRQALEGIYRSRAELIICAGYPTRLDVRPGDPTPAVNVHPSPLPEGRGPAPIPWAIVTGRETTGVTIHEMVERFDAGPILLQRELKLSPRETSASLDSRSRRLAVDLAVELANGFETLWAGRTSQGPATYCRMPRRSDRTLDLRGSVEQMDRVLRAFTPGNILVPIEGREWVVFDAVCWPERHAHRPGALVARKGARRLLAASDGYLLLRSAVPERIARLRFAAGRITRFVR